MKKITLALAAVCITFSACSKKEQAASPSPTATKSVATPQKLSWHDFAAATIDEYYRRNPETAVNDGLHQYDGQMSDVSLAGLDAYADWLEQSEDTARSYADLDGTDAFDRDYLINALNSKDYWIRDSGFPVSNPMYYANAISTSVYVDREYAALPVRLQAYTKYVAGVPALLETMRENLKPPLPAPYLKLSTAILAGLADYFANTVPGIFASVDDAGLQAQFKATNQAAIDAINKATDWLKTLEPTATNKYALGADGFLKMLSATQDVDISLADLKAAGERDLERNLDALHKACAEFAPGKTDKACVLKMQNHKPADGPVEEARRQLPRLRQFIVDHDLASIPGDEQALVDESPPYARFNTAYINIPGPFEKGLPSVFYISPPDPAWTAEQQRAYIPGVDFLLIIAAHEVWPGHFLQFLHANRSKSQVGRTFSTYTFTEGWAHYAEQMMVDAGLGDGDPEVHIGQLVNALMRNVRFMSAIGLHTGGMTVEESRTMFEDKAFLDVGNSIQQADRGTYDPGYLNYTLGKLMIMKLREDWTRDRGGRKAWHDFHDQFLSYGSPPIPLIRKAMLGPDYKGDNALLPD